MKAKESLQKDIQYELDKYNKLMKLLETIPVNLIAEAFPAGTWSTSWGYHFNFTLPFDFALIEEVKKFMAIQFPEYKLSHEQRFVWDESKEAGHFLDYEAERMTEIKYSFRTGRSGTTCILNPIGEKTVPIFEVVCSEGAQESLQVQS